VHAVVDAGGEDRILATGAGEGTILMVPPSIDCRHWGRGAA